MPIFTHGTFSRPERKIGQGSGAGARAYVALPPNGLVDPVPSWGFPLPGQRAHTAGAVASGRNVATVSELAAERPRTEGHNLGKTSRNVVCEIAPNFAWAHPMLLRGREQQETADAPEKPLQPEHIDCLQLPQGLDRLWLLLPAAKRPDVEQLWRVAREMTTVPVEASLSQAMSKLFCGACGPGLLESLAKTAETRPPWTPRTGKNTPRRKLPLLSTLQILPRNTAVPSTSTGRIGAAMQKLGLVPKASEVELWSKPSKPESSQVINRNWTNILGAEFPSQCADIRQATQSGGQLNLGQWWEESARIRAPAREERLDERCFALAALASQTRPAHSSVLANNVSLQNLKLLSLWSKLQQLKIDHGSLASVEGIAGCRVLQEVSFLHCTKLRDLAPLGKCQEIHSIDIRGCTDLESFGAHGIAPDSPKESDREQMSGAFCLLNLRRVHASGCQKLPVAQFVKLYSNVRSIVFPNTKIALLCTSQVPSHDRAQFTADAKIGARQWLTEVIELIKPPVSCSWQKYMEHMDELVAATAYAKSVGVSEGVLQDAEEHKRHAKLALHLGCKLTTEENSRLRMRCGRTGPARLRRCLLLIQYMKIRRLGGVTRDDFCMVLARALDEPKHRLSRVYNFLDVEREGVLTREDFDRLSTGFEGPASQLTVDEFREWAHDKFGGLKRMFSAIAQHGGATHDANGDCVVGYDQFQKAMKKLGWKGMPAEIYALLNDHEPKATNIGLSDFLLIDWLYLSQMDKFKRWLMERYGTVQNAFKAVDLNSSNVVSYTEFRKWLAEEKALLGVGSEDCARFMIWIDLDDNKSITAKEFDALFTFDADRFQADLNQLRALVVEKWSTFRTAFNSMSSIKVSDARAKLGPAAKKTKAAGTRFVGFEQFKQATTALNFNPSHDLRLIFRYLDFDMEGTIVLDDFMALPVVTVSETRGCFSKVKAYLLEQWGSFEESFSGLSRAAMLQREEAKTKPVSDDAEGKDKQLQEPAPPKEAKKPSKGKPAPKKKK